MLKSIISIDIYLPNIKIKCYNEGVESLNELEKFLLIGIEEDRNKILDYIGDDIVMEEFNKEIDEYTLRDDLFEAYDKTWALEDRAKRDGYEAGHEQGIAHERKNIINKLLESGMNVEEISNILKISKIEIEEILND